LPRAVEDIPESENSINRFAASSTRKRSKRKEIYKRKDGQAYMLTEHSKVAFTVLIGVLFP